MERILPKVYEHNLSLMHEGTGSSNNKEYCRCEDCKKLRERRDSIYSGFISKLMRYLYN